jgi:hypothetical protein
MSRNNKYSKKPHEAERDDDRDIDVSEDPAHFIEREKIWDTQNAYGKSSYEQTADVP